MLTAVPTNVLVGEYFESIEWDADCRQYARLMPSLCSKSTEYEAQILLKGLE